MPEDLAKSGDDSIDPCLDAHLLTPSYRAEHFGDSVSSDKHRNERETSGELNEVESEARNRVDAIIPHHIN